MSTLSERQAFCRWSRLVWQLVLRVIEEVEAEMLCHLVHEKMKFLTCVKSCAPSGNLMGCRAAILETVDLDLALFHHQAFHGSTLLGIPGTANEVLAVTIIYLWTLSVSSTDFQNSDSNPHLLSDKSALKQSIVQPI